MSADIVKYAFVAGEISPTLLGRTDLTKYDLAVAEGLNFFVDFRGGLSSRPGTELVGEVHLGDKKTRMFKFQFAPDTANSYVVLFGHNYIRFYQDGGEVISGGSPYEVATPFSEDDLDGLVVEQYRDLLRITSLDFPVYNLVRHDHTNWELAPEDISENALERAVILTEDAVITPAALPERVTQRKAEPLVSTRTPPNPTLEAVERAYIMWVLQSEGGNKSRTADILGIDPSTLYRKLSRYGVDEA